MKQRPPVTSHASGCTLLQLRSFIEGTSLAGNLRYFNRARGVIEQIVRHFRRMMRGINFWELGRVQSLFTGLCMLLLTKGLNMDDLCHKRCNLVVRFMQFVDCVSPMNVHQLVEKLLADLAEQAADKEANILKLAGRLADLGFRGRVLAVCLLWSVLGRRLPALDITMHRFREPGELVEAIRRRPPPIPDVWLMDANGTTMEVLKAEMETLLVLLEAMEQLLNLLLCCDNEDLLQAGYPQQFFAVEDGDGTYLSQWCVDVAKVLPDSLCGPQARFGGPLHNIIGMLMQDRQDRQKPAGRNVDVLMVEVEAALNLSGNR